MKEERKFVFDLEVDKKQEERKFVFNLEEKRKQERLTVNGEKSVDMLMEEQIQALKVQCSMEKKDKFKATVCFFISRWKLEGVTVTKQLRNRTLTGSTCFQVVRRGRLRQAVLKGDRGGHLRRGRTRKMVPNRRSRNTGTRNQAEGNSITRPTDSIKERNLFMTRSTLHGKRNSFKKHTNTKT